ncbi:hypothetical protein [Nocardioides sp. zg-1228]|uniref:hypothetical protein n=1 Tax=Nocardioides sp. zg-1228 TaxID=2763008 RepID=UPI001642E86E|nr:hypothetical protein [Nocardioides sp. zg-1228]MBC2931986.1 hypothetical protein [Nocardioides sp. zg-1228]QSF57542.1 hypothetical protein JX575_18750 [Nocardioides sp. zg-1228]
MVRRHAVLSAVAVVTAAVLAGCSDDAGIVSDASDVDAAVAVWSDPWVAPTSATVAGPALGSRGQVDRVVAQRTTPYAAGVERAARAELRVARSAGWAPTSSTCDDAVRVALVAPTQDAVAQLVVAPDGDGASAAVQVVGRHHLDTAWAVPDPVERTCLDAESPPFEAPPLASAPIGDAGATDADAAWEADDPDGVDALLEQAAADPGLADLGLRVASVSLEEGVNRRRAPAAETTADVTTLAELAGRLPGWRLTYAACGGGGATLATFVRELDAGPAVLTARLGAGGTDLRVTLPVTGGPDPTRVVELPELDDPACTGDTTLRPRHARGVPAVLPSDLTPIAG